LKPASIPACESESIGGEGDIESTLPPLSCWQNL